MSSSLIHKSLISPLKGNWVPSASKQRDMSSSPYQGRKKVETHGALNQSQKKEDDLNRLLQYNI